MSVAGPRVAHAKSLVEETRDPKTGDSKVFSMRADIAKHPVDLDMGVCESAGRMSDVESLYCILRDR